MKDPSLTPGYNSVEHFLTASEALDHLWALANRQEQQQAVQGEAGGEAAAAAVRLQALLAAIAPAASNGQQLLSLLESSVRVLPTGLDCIDALLGGGLREGQLAEVCGPSGSGRTQLCLSAALTTACRGERVVYLDTANSFSPVRLQQLYRQEQQQQQQQQQQQRGQQQPGALVPLEQALELIAVARPHSIFALLTSLGALSAHIKGMPDPKQAPQLLIVDSFSAVVSPQLGGQQHTQGTTLMVAAAKLLKQMAIRHKMAVLVTNHVSMSTSGVGGAGGGLPKPALGEQWRPQPAVRVQLHIDDASGGRFAELAMTSVGRKEGRVLLEFG